MNLPITGGCYCGALRYEIGAEPHSATLCHCADCRRCVGAQSVAWITVTTNAFTWEQGTPARYASSPPVERTFCPTCGSSLTYTHSERPDEIDITTGSLDHPEAYPPLKEIYTDDKLNWG